MARATIDGVEQAFEDAAEGPAIVLIHGWASAGEQELERPHHADRSSGRAQSAA